MRLHLEMESAAGDLLQSHQPFVFETGGSPGGGGGRSNVCLRGLVELNATVQVGVASEQPPPDQPANTSRFVFAGVAVSVTLVPVG